MFYCRSRIWGVNPKSCIFKDYLLKYVPLTSRTSYIKNAIRKTFCFLKMVYSIFDRISDALITTYLTQLLLINCVCVIRYFSKKQFESSILAKSKSFLFPILISPLQHQHKTVFLEIPNAQILCNRYL